MSHLIQESRQQKLPRRIPVNPLENMPTLPSYPLDYTPGLRYVEERKCAIKVNEEGFLTEEEEKLTHHLQEMAFAWNEDEKGNFSEDYLDPVTTPTVEHILWVYRNIPIPPGNYQKVLFSPSTPPRLQLVTYFSSSATTTSAIHLDSAPSRSMIASFDIHKQNWSCLGSFEPLEMRRYGL